MNQSNKPSGVYRIDIDEVVEPKIFSIYKDNVFTVAVRDEAVAERLVKEFNKLKTG